MAAAPPSTPEQNTPVLSHFVLVADQRAADWSATESALLAARQKFPKIVSVPSTQFAANLSPLPALVAYDTAGTPLTVNRGQANVLAALSSVPTP